jgi:hypothetical protein
MSFKNRGEGYTTTPLDKRKAVARNRAAIQKVSRTTNRRRK